MRSSIVEAPGKASCRLVATAIMAVSALLVAGIVFGQGNGQSRDWDDVIQEVDDGSMVVNGVRYTIDERAKVKKDRYKFGIDDLRPGWKVSLKKRGNVVQEIEVSGIPAVAVYPAYGGIKTRVGVGRVRMGSIPADMVQATVDLQSAIESLLLAALEATGRFIVVDIRSRDEILNEVDFSQTAYVNEELATQVGRQVPAEYIVRGHVVSFGQEKKDGGGLGMFGVKVGSHKTSIGVRMQLSCEEVATGAVVGSFTDDVTYCSKGSAFGFDVGALASGLSAFTNDLGKLGSLQKLAGTGLEITERSYCESPVGEVLGLVTNRLVEQLCACMEDVAWASVVISTLDDNAVIRGGGDVGLRPGDILAVFKSTGELIDPETGLSLGRISAPIGFLTVTSVQEKVSICTYRGNDKPSRGDKCILERNPGLSRL